MIAFTRGVKGPVIDEDAIAFLFNASPSVGVTEGGTGASEAPRMDAEAFMSFILEQFKARATKNSRKPWDEAKEYIYQVDAWDVLRHPWRYRDAEFIRTLSETIAYPDKLDFDELMSMWLSLPRWEKKKVRKQIAYKITEYAAEEFLKLIAQSEKVRTDADLRRELLRIAQAFVDKNIGVRNLTRALEDMYLDIHFVKIDEDLEKDVRSFLAGVDIMEETRKDKLRELVKKYIVDELTAIEKKLEEEAEEEEEYFYWDEDPYSVPCDNCEEDEEEYYDYDEEDCGCLEEDDYDYDDDP